MTLFQKAVGTDKELKVEWNKDEIWFDWFDSVIPNEKLGLYISFLHRSGLSGMEYKPLRKELMRNLSGDGAFRYGRPERCK